MTRILDKVAQLAADTAPTRGERDMTLWHAWKKTPSDTNMSALLSQVNPLIHREANKWAGSLARPLLVAEGQRLAVGAFHSYDPSKGAALGTHVVNALQKMSRLSYSNQNVARLPENKMLMFHSFNVAQSKLTDEHGRPPTTDELADHLGWSIKHLTTFRKEIGHQELLESGGNTPDGGNAGLYDSDESDHTLDFVHHDLPPSQKLIFEHLTGYGGAPILSNAEIQKKLNLTQGQYSYLKQRLVATIEKTTGSK